MLCFVPSPEAASARLAPDRRALLALRSVFLRGEMGYMPRGPTPDDSRTVSGFVKIYENEEKRMAVDGDWNLTMTTPMGERDATLSLKSSGAVLTGTQGADGNTAEIFDGTVNGNDLTWKVSITNPMPLTLEFTGKVAGDSMSGEMGIGPMGSFPFTGKRA